MDYRERQILAAFAGGEVAELAAQPVTEAERAAAAARRDAHALAATLSLQESADVLGVDPSEVERRCSDGQLWAIDVQGEQRIPGWQFVGRSLLPGLTAVIAAIPPRYPFDVVEARVHARFEELRDRSIVDHLAAGGSPALAARLVDELARW